MAALLCLFRAVLDSSWSVCVSTKWRGSLRGSISACSTLLQKDHEADGDEEPSETNNDAQGRKRLKGVQVMCV